MTQKTLTMLAISTLILLAPATLGSGSGTTDRDADYIGTTLLAPPPDSALPPCDSTQGPHLGGVLFCGVPIGRTVTITVHDSLLASPAAMVTCPTAAPPSSHTSLGSANPTLTVTIPQACDMDPADKSDTTRVGVFVTSGFTGTVTLTFL